jgi:hypothetical protein
MATFNLTFTTDSSALTTEDGYLDHEELRRIIASVATLVAPGNEHRSGNVRDINGNTVGSFALTGLEADRLEYLREQIHGECISMGEIHELQGMVKFIDPGDLELLEWAGVPEELTSEADPASAIRRWADQQ